MNQPAKSAPAARSALRTNDPERTRADILAVATQEFLEHGYSGARVDDIAERTRTSKRMIYYYFGSKDGLYRTVLLEYYHRLRGAEGDLHLQDKPPLEALTQLVAFTFDFHVAHAEQVRLVMVENIHRGRHIAELPTLERVNLTVIDLVRDILARGVAEGVFRKAVEANDLYMTIAALSFFNVSNRYTFSRIFSHDMTSAKAVNARRKSVLDMVLRYACVDP